MQFKFESEAEKKNELCGCQRWFHLHCGPASSRHSESPQRIELTPWDLNFLGVNNIERGLIFHKPPGGTWITQLKTSLSRTLNIFFPLAGRLVTETYNDNTISVFIECNDAGAEFVHATIDLTVDDILGPVYIPDNVGDFFHPIDSINIDGQSRPLLSVQVTELTDGIFVGCSMNHSVVDGSSFWHFVNSWSEICRSNSDHQISRLPIFDRSFLNLPIKIPASICKGFTRSCNIPTLEDTVFHFAPQNIAKLKAKAKLEINNDSILISSLQVVLAHVWRSFTRARNLDSEVVVGYRLYMGNRTKLNPPLPNEYFGSSTNSCLATAKTGELVNQGLGFAAELLNRVVNAYNDAKVRGAWNTWVEKPGIFCLDDLHGELPMLSTGSSPRFNVYGNDFGWGCPIGLRSGSGNKFDGKMSVFPGAVKGSMEIEACAFPETLKAMREDPEFMQFVGVVKCENLLFEDMD